MERGSEISRRHSLIEMLHVCPMVLTERKEMLLYMLRAVYCNSVCILVDLGGLSWWCFLLVVNQISSL
jgi:hypothetical protein